MALRKPRKPAEGEHLPIRAEDKSWKDWFSKLSKEEHEDHLAKLGLDKDEISEWEEDVDELHSGKPLSSSEEVPLKEDTPPLIKKSKKSVKKPVTKLKTTKKKRK